MKRLILACALLLAACAQQPLSQQIAHGYEQLNQYVLRTETMVDLKVVTKEDAQKRLDLVKKARNGLHVTEVALAACADTRDCALAQQRYAAAQVTLTELERLYWSAQ